MLHLDRDLRGSIGRLDPRTRTFTEFLVPTTACCPNDIAAGADGRIWFTEFGRNKIGAITTSGVITEYPLPTPRAVPDHIAAGPDGNLWFTEYAEHGRNWIGRITPAGDGRITTLGAISECAVPTPSHPDGITQGPDGAMWFVELAGNNIARLGP